MPHTTCQGRLAWNICNVFAKETNAGSSGRNIIWPHLSSIKPSLLFQTSGDTWRQGTITHRSNPGRRHNADVHMPSFSISSFTSIRSVAAVCPHLLRDQSLPRPANSTCSPLFPNTLTTHGHGGGRPITAALIACCKKVQLVFGQWTKEARVVWFPGNKGLSCYIHAEVRGQRWRDCGGGILIDGWMDGHLVKSCLWKRATPTSRLLMLQLTTLTTVSRNSGPVKIFNGQWHVP